jgi:hypothetical protein
MSPAKIAILQLKVVLPQERIDERKSHEESSWRSQSGPKSGWQLRIIAMGNKWQKNCEVSEFSRASVCFAAIF